MVKTAIETVVGIRKSVPVNEILNFLKNQPNFDQHMFYYDGFIMAYIKVVCAESHNKYMFYHTQYTPGEFSDMIDYIG
jgi:hypothetical protein